MYQNIENYRNDVSRFMAESRLMVSRWAGIARLRITNAIEQGKMLAQTAFRAGLDFAAATLQWIRWVSVNGLRIGYEFIRNRFYNLRDLMSYLWRTTKYLVREFPHLVMRFARAVWEFTLNLPRRIKNAVVALYDLTAFIFQELLSPLVRFFFRNLKSLFKEIVKVALHTLFVIVGIAYGITSLVFEAVTGRRQGQAPEAVVIPEDRRAVAVEGDDLRADRVLEPAYMPGYRRDFAWEVELREQNERIRRDLRQGSRPSI